MATAFENVTPAYVDLLTSNKWAARTSVSAEFDALKTMFMVYLNSNTCHVPAKKYTHGLALLLAHFYATDSEDSQNDGGASAVGSVTSEKVGDIMVTYSGVPTSGGVQGWKSWLTQSIWGTQFLFLWKTFKSSALVT